MEENILRIVQLALAINRAEQDRIECEMRIHENGDISLKVIEHMEMYSAVRKFGSGKVYYPNQLISCRLSGNVNDELADSLIKKLENICQSIGIDTSERYMKVQVCR